MAGQKAVFFDRDDTLIEDVPYNGDPELVTLMPQAKEACRLLKDNGFQLYVVSNQSGVGRGLITKEQVQSVNDRVRSLLGEDIFAAIYNCYDAPEAPPDCRKPSAKMIRQAAEDFDLDLPHSFMVGDKASDIEAGRNAGCHAILFSPPHRFAPLHLRQAADYCSSDLLSIATWILTQQDD